MVEAQVAEWSDPREQEASLTNVMKSESLELKIMPGLMTEAAGLRQELSETRKEIESRWRKASVVEKSSDKEGSIEGTVVGDEGAGIPSLKGCAKASAGG